MSCFNLLIRVLIPQVVQQEIANERSPDVVKAWISQPPEWLLVQAVDVPSDGNLDNLDPGERAAIAIASSTPSAL